MKDFVSPRVILICHDSLMSLKCPLEEVGDILCVTPTQTSSPCVVCVEVQQRSPAGHSQVKSSQDQQEGLSPPSAGLGLSIWLILSTWLSLVVDGGCPVHSCLVCSGTAVTLCHVHWWSPTLTVCSLSQTQVYKYHSGILLLTVTQSGLVSRLSSKYYYYYTNTSANVHMEITSVPWCDPVASSLCVSCCAQQHWGPSVLSLLTSSNTPNGNHKAALLRVHLLIPVCPEWPAVLWSALLLCIAASVCTKGLCVSLHLLVFSFQLKLHRVHFQPLHRVQFSFQLCLAVVWQVD